MTTQATRRRQTARRRRPTNTYRGKALTSYALAVVCLLATGSCAGNRTPTITTQPPTVEQSTKPVEVAQKGPVEPVEARPIEWTSVEAAITEAKHQTALDLTLEQLALAIAQNDDHNQAIALITASQLRSAMGARDTAIEELRTAAWPSAGPERAVLEVFYAESLHQYLDAQSWQIRQRERMGSRSTLSIENWTFDQILEEAHAAFYSVWGERESWGTGDASSQTVPMGGFIQNNTFPKHIRGTLRDRLSYLWVALLQNSSYWSARESNDVGLLDLDVLLSSSGSALRTTVLGTETTIGSEAPVDGAIDLEHPVLRASAVLFDLERWHAHEGRAEAAMEAARARFTQLRSALGSSDAAMKRIHETWQERVQGYDRNLPWWSMAMATLAQMQEADDPNDDLRAARATAIAARDQHPSSVGGLIAEAMVERIEAPFANVEGMRADAAERRSLEVKHRNLDQLHFRAWRVDLDQRLRDSNLNFGDRKSAEAIVGKGGPDYAWSSQLAPTPDFALHRTYVSPPLQDPGLYLISASNHARPTEDDWQTTFPFLLTDLVLLTENIPSSLATPDNPVTSHDLEYTVRNGTTGKPVAGAVVDLYVLNRQRGNRKIRSLLTGLDGTARLSDPGKFPRNRQILPVAHHQGHSALDPRGRRAAPDITIEPTTATLLYTDRSVYRPGQTLHWKAVGYEGMDLFGEFSTLEDVAIKVELRDANYQVIATETKITNAFGSVSGEFRLASDRLLGYWTVTATVEGRESRESSASIRVEEYKRPTFEVTVNEPETQLRLNRPAQLTGEARYYFGLPVSDGSASWRITRREVYPYWWWRHARGRGPQTVAQGVAPIDADGKFKVTFQPTVEEPEGDAKAITYVYQLTADVTDEGGETRTGERGFHLGFVTVKASIDSPVGFIRSSTLDADPGVQWTIKRSDLDGTAQPGTGRWSIVRLAQPETTLLPADQPVLERTWSRGTALSVGDHLRPRHAPGYGPEQILRLWEAGATVASGEIDHGEDGAAAVDPAAVLEQPQQELKPGAYRLLYSTVDSFGAAFNTQHEFIVVADAPSAATSTVIDPILNLPAALERESGSVEVGEAARFLVHSGLKDQELRFEIVRDGQRLSSRTLTSRETPLIVDIPVTQDLRGGFVAVVTALRDHQLMRLEEQVTVPWSDRKIDLSFHSFRDRLRPGDQETWTIKATPRVGVALEQGAAELLAYMYDRSLDVFGPHQPPEVAHYQWRTGGGYTTSSLGSFQTLWRTGRLFTPQQQTMPAGDQFEVWRPYGLGVASVFQYGRSRRDRMRRGAPAPSPSPPALQAAVVPELNSAITVTSESPMLDERRLSQGAQVTQTELEKMPTAEDPWAALAGNTPGVTGAEPEIRTNFTETAFWHPHLLTGNNGSVSFEFTVPDSVTDWNIWLHAVTKDLRGGSKRFTAKTVKDLLVRPYLPRFLREGDTASLSAVVNNSGEETLDGELHFDIIDPETEESLLSEFGLSPADARRVFRVLPGEGTTLGFDITTPARVGTVAFRVTATAGDLSDGELRPIPILPARFHLQQSRFTALQGKDKQKLRFEELERSDDPTRINEQLVVTLDAQLFYSVLNALPYLVNYPYQCTEQTLNRFLSTGILSSLYTKYPAVQAMADSLAERETQLERFDQADANRTSNTMLLEESPWLNQSQGNKRGGADPDLINVLDSAIAGAQQRTSFAKLQQSQNSDGGFPWFPDGRSSAHVTLTLIDGFSRALEFQVDLPPETEQMVRRAWQFLKTHYDQTIAKTLLGDGCCPQFTTYLSYVLSNYSQAAALSATGGNDWSSNAFTAEERARMLDHSFRAWRAHSPRLKALLALSLDRADRAADAKLVFDSVMDTAKTDRDLGTYWAPEARSWLWYNDTIEGHALALRAMMELEPTDDRRHGLVQWLLLNKKLNHWKSTRATAEVLYALVHYLDAEGQLGIAEAADVTLAGNITRFDWAPDEYTGQKNQLVLAAAALDTAAEAKKAATIIVEKDTPGLMFASATWHFSTEQLPQSASSDFFSVKRQYFLRSPGDDGFTLTPLNDGDRVAIGDQVEVQISLGSKHNAEYVHLRDPRAAGFEPITQRSGWRWDSGIGRYEEVRDSGMNFFFERLPVGEYTMRYRLRATTSGTFRVSPANVQSMYAPEFAAYSSGRVMSIDP